MSRRRRIIAILIFISFTIVVTQTHLTGIISEMPLSKYYIQNAFSQTAAVNVVTSIYLNFRYYDTLFEALMLLFSIIGVIYMSVHEGGDYDE